MKRLIYLLLLLPFLSQGQTVGIKVAAPIIKNNPSDNTVTGYANLLNGGYHTVGNLSGRDSLVTSFNKTLNTGMLVYVNDVDSTYRWSGTDWTPVLSGGITPEILSDSLLNYERKRDGLISGGSATIGSGSVTIDTAYYRLLDTNRISLPRTFTGIANSPTGTQYYLLVYGKADATLDTISGVRDTIAAIPNNPVNTVKINTILVGDGGVESTAPDLSGYAELNASNIFTQTQTINNGIGGYVSLILSGQMNSYGSRFYARNNNNFTGAPDFTLRPQSDGVGFDKFQFQGGNSQRVDLDWDKTTGLFDFKSNPTVNGVPIGSGGGTVTSITPAFGFTSTTPITTSGTLAIDTSQVQAKLNDVNFGDFMDNGLATKMTPSSGDGILARDIITNEAVEINYSSFQSPLTFTSPLVNTSGVISIPQSTGSVNGYLSSTDWSTFNNKLSTTGSGASLTNVVNSITGTTNQVIASASTGAVTLSLPQSINTTATPQFSRLGLGSASSSSTALLLPAGTTSISSFRMPNGVAPTSPVSGDEWSLTTGLRRQTFDGTNTKDFIFSTANFLFTGTGVRAVTSNPVGDLVATTPILETFTTDSDVIAAIVGGTYNRNSFFSDTIAPASSKVFYKGQMYKSNTYLYVATNDNVSFRTALEGSTTGWASYVDNAYTVGSPFAIASGMTSTLPNNASSSIANNLPIGVTSFYNSGTSKITPTSLGDTYNFAIRFKAKTTATTDFLDFGIDIGGAIGVVFKESKVFLKGANTEMDFVFTVPAYVQSTFLANGGLIKITAHTGDLSIYDIVFDIIRTGKGIQ